MTYKTNFIIEANTIFILTSLRGNVTYFHDTYFKLRVMSVGGIWRHKMNFVQNVCNNVCFGAGKGSHATLFSSFEVSNNYEIVNK